MDEHGIAFDGSEAGADRIRSLGAAFDRIADIEPAERGGRQVLLPFANHDTNGLHRRVTDQRLHRPAKHGLSAEEAILLGHVAA